MQLPKALKDRLAREFRFAATKMAETPNVQRKLYFYSAFFGEATRVLNQSWDSELSLLHLVVQSSHRLINSRVMAYATGADRVIDIPEGLPQALDEVADRLAGVFEQPEVDSNQLTNVMKRIAELAYVTTGNGYYLYERGTLKI